MERHPIGIGYDPNKQMAHSTVRLCTGIPTGANKQRVIHENNHWYDSSYREKRRLCPPIKTKRIRAETGRPCMEPIPGTKAYIPAIGFVQSKYDECVFYKKNMVYILYTDDSIIAGSDRKAIEDTIQQIKQAGLDITIEGDIETFWASI